MPTTFDQLTAASARQLLGMGSIYAAADALECKRDRDAIKANKAFVRRGDYFQDGEQGAFPGLLSDDTGDTKEAVEVEFATSPVLEGISRRRRRGVVGREPSGSHEPEDGPDEQGEDDETQRSPEQVLADSCNAVLTPWWDGDHCLFENTRMGVHGLCQAAMDSLNVTGEIAVRLFPRQNAAVNGEIKQASNLASAYDLLYAELLPDGLVQSYLDRDSMREILGYEFKESTLEADGRPVEKQRMVVTYLNDERLAVVRSWTNEAEDPPADPLDLNGLLPIWRIKTCPFLSLPLRQLQNQLSKTITMMGHNNNLAGFLELIATGLLPPGEWQQQTVDGKSTYVYVQDETAEVGPGKMAFLNQAMVYDEQAGGWKFPPSSGINRIEPIDPAYLIKSAEYLYLCMLRTADQDHTLMSGDATASAVSRVESRAQFVWSLLEAKVVIEAMLRWLLEALLLMAVNLTLTRTPKTVGGQQVRMLSGEGVSALEKYKSLRVRVDVHASAGPLAPDEKRVVIELYQAGLMARETAIVYIGTEDIDAEINALDEDPLRIAAVIEAQGRAMNVLKQIMPVDLALDVVTGEKKFAEATAMIPADFVDPATAAAEQADNGVRQ